ncbi:MAG TPA: hypothetical protein VFQ40_08970, partial [Actinomycetota bacterium]|nr:hypothetical protein [Actinomycetota bacterium]
MAVAMAALAAIVTLLVTAAGPSTDGPVLFRDDFSEAVGSRWLQANDDRGSMGPSDGSYRIAVRDGGELQSIAQLARPERNVRIDVDATMADGVGGLSVLCVSEPS